MYFSPSFVLLNRKLALVVVLMCALSRSRFVSRSFCALLPRSDSPMRQVSQILPPSNLEHSSTPAAGNENEAELVTVVSEASRVRESS